MKRRKCIIIIVILVISIIVVNYVIDNKNRLKISNDLLNCLNNEKEVPYFETKDYDYLEYAKKENVNNYIVTGVIKNYIDLVDKSVEAKINKLDEKAGFFSVYYEPNKIGYEHYKNIIGKYRDIRIHGLRASQSKFILKNVTENDILNYENSVLKEKLITELKKYFKYENDEWYIVSDIDLHIELPFGVYADYVSDKRESNNIKSFLDIEILNGELRKIKNSNTVISFKYKYETIDGKIVEGINKLGARKDEKGNIKIDANYLISMYGTLGNYASLTFGQHDYDEEERRIREEEATLVNEYGKITPPNVYEREQSKKVVNSEILEVPEFIKYKAEAVVVINTYDDGSIDYRFRASKITDSLGSSSNKNYILKYTDIKDIEDLLKKYLADKKNFKNDEKWLEKGNYYYNEK